MKSEIETVRNANTPLTVRAKSVAVFFDGDLAFDTYVPYGYSRAEITRFVKRLATERAYEREERSPAGNIRAYRVSSVEVGFDGYAFIATLETVGEKEVSPAIRVSVDGSLGDGPEADFSDSSPYGY